MDVLTVDFETYYDKDHSISDMCMGEYLNGKKSQLILMSYKLNDGEVKCAVGEEEMAAVLKTFDWSQVAVCSHNGHFDFKIIVDKFGHTPAFFFDTLGMMSATGGNVVANGNTLECVAKLLQGAGIAIADKGEERGAAKGKRLFKFPDGRWYMHEEEINETFIVNFRSKNYTKKGELKKGKKHLVDVAREAIQFFEDYKAYCIHDTEICYAALQYFTKLLPLNEIKFQDMMMRCYVLPRLALDKDILIKEKHRLDKRRLEKVRPVADKYFNGNIETAKEYLRSKRLFGVLLQTMGGITDQSLYESNSRGEEVDYSFIIPTKVSEKTGKVDYAFSLTDEAFLKMAELSPELEEVCAARKEMASSIEHSRTQRFLDSAEWESRFGLGYKISGAATHRLSGGAGSKNNVQNLSSGRKEGQTTALRDSICSPDDQHTIVVSDSSQVEARVLAFISGCKRQLEIFSSGTDFYSSIGQDIYNEPAEYINKMRKAGDHVYINKRSVAKACGLGLGYGMGAEAFVDNAFVLAGVTLDLERSKELKAIYERSYFEIPALWKTCNKVLGHMLAGGNGYFGGPTGKLFYYDGAYEIHGKKVPSIIGPDGMRLSYYKLSKRAKEYEDGSVRANYAYWGLKEGRYQWVYIWGSKLVENLCQYLAFAMMKWQGLRINEKYPPSLNTHDEWGLLVEDTQLYPAITYVMDSMRTVPSWLDGLVVDCECEIGRQYGQCEEVTKSKLLELKNQYEIHG